MGQGVWCPQVRRKKDGRNFLRSGCAGIRVHDPRRLCKDLHATRLDVRGLAGAGSSIFWKAREQGLITLSICLYLGIVLSSGCSGISSSKAMAWRMR